MRKVEDSVVVLTGASSGIARAAAVALAERGASVVVAARDAAALDQVAAECEAKGVRALAVPTDVTDEEQVQALARAARSTFGRIDVWVNAAAVIVFGEFEKTPSDVYRRVLETNLFGQIHGARAVLPTFREQRSGVLVNVGSVWGSVTSPYVSAYVVSKFGVRAFSESLQEALRLQKATKDIRVCTVLPQSVDTPIFRHAGNYTSHVPKPVPPVVGPERVVRAIIRSIEHPRRQRMVGVCGRFLEVGHVVLPGLYGRIVPRAMNRLALSRASAPSGPGNVFESVPSSNREYGDWRMSRLQAARGVFGLAMLAAPAALAEKLLGAPAGRATSVALRLLGARHLGQAVLSGSTPSTRAFLTDAGVDTAHAVSMLVLAGARPQWRRAALGSAGVAAAFAAASVRAAARSSRGR
ncbi:MAG TPA: SDR family oxidoreductase [Nocardioidaceae bacterium]|nr:SDR family oxidoreductase [Nocardioidaceae bacterium]